jgi:hypothetical protein
MLEMPEIPTHSWIPTSWLADIDVWLRHETRGPSESGEQFTNRILRQCYAILDELHTRERLDLEKFVREVGGALEDADAHHDSPQWFYRAANRLELDDPQDHLNQNAIEVLGQFIATTLSPSGAPEAFAERASTFVNERLAQARDAVAAHLLRFADNSDHYESMRPYAAGYRLAGERLKK